MLPNVLLMLGVSGVIWIRISLDSLTKINYFFTKRVGSKSHCALSCLMDRYCEEFGFLNDSCYYLMPGRENTAAAIGEITLPSFFKMNDVEQNTSSQQNYANVTELLSQGYRQYDSYFLKFYTVRKDWQSAKTICSDEGSSLYALDTIMKRTILLQFLTDITYTSGGTFHVGLKKKADGSWAWPNNTTNVFYWSSNQQPLEECARFEYPLFNVSTGQCTNHNEFLCEKWVPQS